MVQSTLHGVQSNTPKSRQPVDNENADKPSKTNNGWQVATTASPPKTASVQLTTSTAGKKGSRGAFKSQLYGLRRKHP